mgnify:CR=1 FL=1
MEINKYSEYYNVWFDSVEEADNFASFYTSGDHTHENLISVGFAGIQALVWVEVEVGADVEEIIDNFRSHNE